MHRASICTLLSYGGVRLSKHCYKIKPKGKKLIFQLRLPTDLKSTKENNESFKKKNILFNTSELLGCADRRGLDFKVVSDFLDGKSQICGIKNWNNHAEESKKCLRSTRFCLVCTLLV